MDASRVDDLRATMHTAFCTATRSRIAWRRRMTLTNLLLVMRYSRESMRTRLPPPSSRKRLIVRFSLSRSFGPTASSLMALVSQSTGTSLRLKAFLRFLG